MSLQKLAAAYFQKFHSKTLDKYFILIGQSYFDSLFTWIYIMKQECHKFSEVKNFLYNNDE